MLTQVHFLRQRPHGWGERDGFQHCIRARVGAGFCLEGLVTAAQGDDAVWILYHRSSTVNLKNNENDAAASEGMEEAFTHIFRKPVFVGEVGGLDHWQKPMHVK
eukprot:1427893-Rhodomonas_salina.2